MTTKRVLILEDRPALRIALREGLSRRGLTAIASGSAEEARQLLAEYGDVDVVLLDISLGEGSIETGLDFGMQLRMMRKEWPPEFLVYSAHDEADYYRTAMALGAAGYLRKGRYGGDPSDPGATEPPKVEVLAEHVRALALRRALQIERPGMTERLARIAEASASREQAIEHFCRDVLAPELEAALGGRFVLLLSNQQQTVCFTGTELESLQGDSLGQLERAIHDRLGEAEPLVVNARNQRLSDAATGERGAEETLRALDGAAFIALGEANSIRLSLGLVPTGGDAAIIKSQMKLLDRYLQRPVIRHLLEIIDLWSARELAIEREKRQVLLRATADFCLYEGNQLSSLLSEAEKEAGNDREWPALGNLRAVADEMREAGELLVYFGSAGRQPYEDEELERIDMKSLVEQIWREDAAPRLALAFEALEIFGQCVAWDSKERIGRAVSLILVWLGQRLVRSPRAPRLVVRCASSSDSDKVDVVFEEYSSRRLPQDLKATLFAPFLDRTSEDRPTTGPEGGRRLGLYVASTLAEFGGGVLLDRSDAMDGSFGHRIVLELTAASESQSL